MADELIDILDQDMNIIGQAMKSQAHKEGLWHQVFHCWIVKRHPNGNHKIWLQLRGKDMELYPDLLHISAAGQIQAGEKPRQGSREVEEEIGIQVDPSQLQKLFIYTLIEDYKKIINREFCHTYLYETSQELKDLSMQPEEVYGVFEINYLDALNLFNEDTEHVKINGYIRNDNNTYSHETRKVSKKDFVPHGDKFYLKTFQTIKRYFENTDDS